MKEEKIRFKCDMCGLCCQNLKEAPIRAKLDRGDGICRHFDTKSHMCKIYNTRPVICNVDKFYNLFLKNKMSKICYYELNYAACRQLKHKFKRTL